MRRALCAGLLLAFASGCMPGATEGGAAPGEACLRDKDCPQSFYCVSGACQMVPATCATWRDCTSPDTCLHGHCIPGCSVNGCADGQKCDPVSNLCVAAPGSDAGAQDAGDPGAPDAGTPDAGDPDAGTPDAGPPAGPPDAGPVLQNGDFEGGTLAGWTASGTTSVAATGHGGSHSAQVGGTAASSDSALSQQIVVPAGSPQLSFWFKSVCQDVVQYDWASVTVTSLAGAVLLTPLGPTCTNSGAWVQATADLSTVSGQQVLLTLANHDDGYPGDPTYTLFDDLQVTPGAPPAQDFVLSATPPAVTGAGSATIAAAPSGGFSSSIGLAISGAPAGSGASLSATSISAGGSATLTLAPGTAAAGTYTVTVTGASGSLSHAASVSWTIAAAVCTTDTWGNYAASFMSNNCAYCHSFANTYSGTKANASSSQTRIQSGNMPQDHTLSASDKQRILKWFSCGLPQ